MTLKKGTTPITPMPLPKTPSMTSTAKFVERLRAKASHGDRNTFNAKSRVPQSSDLSDLSDFLRSSGGVSSTMGCRVGGFGDTDRLLAGFVSFSTLFFFLSLTLFPGTTRAPFCSVAPSESELAPIAAGDILRHQQVGCVSQKRPEGSE